MRSKEEAFDYRYFAEPDLVPLAPSAELVDRIRPARSGRCPPSAAGCSARSSRPTASRPRSTSSTTVVALGLDDLVVAAVELGADARLALARAANEAAARPDAARMLEPARFAELITLEGSGKLSATQAKAVLAEMLDRPAARRPRSPSGSVSRRSADPSSTPVIDSIAAAHPAEWQRFVDGDEKVVQFLTGQVMRQTKGRANGKAVAESLARRRG